ncbi:DUF6265 family protein [Balneola sp. MJW-20]|uniref:DUF6265 family protein n=1 Tax=Gracilimonas aurantiaca TaxID=3234185 RepID=UPI003466C5F6
MKKFSLLLPLLLIGMSLNAQSTMNTMSFDPQVGSPSATLDDIAWMEGHWKGEAFGGIIEEIWSPPAAGSMMCSFRLIIDGKVSFYEIVTITEENGSLMLRLKHFDDDLKGWEEKDESIDFPLVKVSPGKIYFDGFTFEKVSDDEIIIYVIIDNSEGSYEKAFPYKRVK